MGAILLWAVRFFGIYVFVRGVLLLSEHRQGDLMYFVEHHLFQVPALLTLAGLVILLLAFRRGSV